MFVEAKVFKVEVGTGNDLIERFSKRDIITKQSGIIDLMVMQTFVVLIMMKLR